jgi:membrane-bound metal-dependent hydrolase YbcI (DUF457 family)
MPNYRGHLVGGATTYGIVVATLIATRPSFEPRIDDLAVWLIMCLLGSLFPDVDIRSKGKHIFYHFLLLIMIIALISKNWNAILFIVLTALFPHFARHRGTMHSIWFILAAPFLIITGLTIFYGNTIITPAFGCYIFFVAGALSHLVLDFGLVRLIKRAIPKKRIRHRRKRH